ncbi:MAG: sialate O-acetylesterase [Bacteroidetes bacterium]|nr:sialate O-acetylesterase [Bacteroidota bacterium]
MKTSISISIFLILSLQSLQAQLSIAKPFGSHMVLQRNKPLPVWGWATKNENIEVKFNQYTLQTKSDANGKWHVQFPAMKEGGPFQLEVKSNKEILQLEDVMLGEVWLCSGQSNMEFNMRDAFHYNTASATVKQYDIRQFLVPSEVGLQPKDSIAGGDWVLASNETLGNYTAVGYSFAKELASQLHVTVGLIKDAWGGSQIEGWISKDAMMDSEELKPYANSFPENWDQADAQLLKKLQKKLSTKNNQLPNTDLNYLLSNDSTAFDGWLAYAPPSQWDWQGIWAFRGAGFFERTLTVDMIEVSKPSTLSLGDNDGAFQLYINGKLIKEGQGKNSRLFQLPANTWKQGRNILLIHQDKQVDPAWFGNGFSGEANTLFLKFDGYAQSLSGNGWKMVPDFKSPWNYIHAQNNAGAIIYNAMIHPIIPFAIQGVLWYQGESNAERAYQYRKSFPLLIESWRKEWKDDFPFYFVQLASYGKFPNSNQGSEWAELREAQSLTLSLAKTGMAVTTDIGNPENVHPRNKEDVGKRLAANALANTYHMPITIFCGPTYRSVVFKQTIAEISFDHVGLGWFVKDQYGYIKGFEIAGADKKFYYAQAKIEGDKIIVWNDKVIEPKSVRYGWTDSPVDANLFNQEGFPAAPFRTDQWKGITEGKKFE